MIFYDIYPKYRNLEFLALCILVNVLLSIIFKFFPKYGINNFQAIIFNYFTCLIVGTFQLGTFPVPVNFVTLPWFPFVIGLGFLFIIGFNLNAIANQKIGVAYTALLQKLSLIIPSSFALLFFNESATFIKILGIVIALIAIAFIQMPSKKVDGQINAIEFKKMTLLGSGIFIISAIIEVVLFYMSKVGISAGSDIEIVSSTFGLAGILGLILLLIQLYQKKVKFEMKNVFAGIILGIPNFYSIYLLLYLLNRGWEASVLFPMNNVGIIGMAAIVGYFLFKEKLNSYKWIGMGLAIISIILISK